MAAAKTREAFTVREASVITGQSAARIHRLFDEGPLSARGGAKRRLLRQPELVFVVATSAEPLSRLDRAGKRQVYRSLAAALKVETTAQVRLGEWVAVSWRRLRSKVRAGTRALAKARALVVRDEAIRGGEPVVRGTRVPVYTVGELLKAGASAEEIVTHYPSVTEKQVELAGVFARAYPRRGRPPRLPWHG